MAAEAGCGPVSILKSVITGNVATDGGGLFYNLGTTTRDLATIVRGSRPIGLAKSLWQQAESAGRGLSSRFATG